MPGRQQDSKLLILLFTHLADAVSQQAKSAGQVGSLIAANEVPARPIDMPTVLGVHRGGVRQRARCLWSGRTAR